MLVEHLRIELLQFVEQNLVFAFDVVRISRHHEQQQRVALDMTEEAETEALTFRGSLDDTRDIGHHERLVVAIAHDAEGGLHRGEGIVGNLGTGIGEGRH